jgi:chromate reductase
MMEHASESVRALRSAIETSDGMIVGSPEYNHGMSGVLKNALDWAFRPYGQSTLGSKPVLTMTASLAFTGGVRAQQQMNETLVSIPARLVHRPQIVIGGVHEEVRDGRLVDEATLRLAPRRDRQSTVPPLGRCAGAPREFDPREGAHVGQAVGEGTRIFSF